MASSTNCGKPTEHVGVSKVTDQNTDVTCNELPLNDLKTLHFFYNVGMNYFRSCATVPPPPMTSSSLHQLAIQPIIPPPTLHQTSCRAAVERSTASTSFQTNVRPPTPIMLTSQKLPTRKITDKNSSNIGIQQQQQQQQQQAWSANKAASNSTVKVILSSSPVQRLSPDAVPLDRQLKDQPAVSMTLAVQPLQDKVMLREIDFRKINPDRQSVSKFAKNVDNNFITDRSEQENLKQQRNDENEEVAGSQSVTTGVSTNGSLVGSSAWDAVQLVENEPRSPADSGWMSDVSVSASSNSCNEEGEGNFLSSCSPLHVDADGGDNTVDKMRGNDDHESSKEPHVMQDGGLSSDADVTSSSRKPTRFAKVPEKSNGLVESVEGGGQSGGEGDDEDSLFSLSFGTLETQKRPGNETTTRICPTTDHARADTMRPVQGRVMKNIPVRFQRLLEAEVQRVAAVRRRVEGQPLYAAAAPDLPSVAVIPQHCVMRGSSNVANEPVQISSLMSTPTSWGGNANVYPHMAPNIPVPPPGYQWHYNSDQVSYGPMPGSYFFPGAPPVAGSMQPPTGETITFGSGPSSMHAPAQFMQSPAATTYQPAGTYSDGSFYQPCYETYPNNLPTYVIYVDNMAPTMAGDQPGCFSSATPYDYRMMAPPPSNVGTVPSGTAGDAGGCHSSKHGTGSISYETTPLLVNSTAGNTVIQNTQHFAADPVHGNAPAPTTTNKLIPLS